MYILKIVLIFNILILVSFGCEKNKPEKYKFGYVKEKVMFDGIERNFLYRLPTDFEQSKKSPLIILLHAFQETAESSIDMSYLSLIDKSERDNAIMVFPNAVDMHWNDYMGGSYPSTDTVDDTGFLKHLIEYFIKEFNCDNERVYVMGFSNGGTMTYRLSLEIPEKLTAIATFISTMGQKAMLENKSAVPLPVMITNGTADTVFKWQGGKLGLPGRPLIVASSVNDNINYWKKRNGIVNEPDTIPIADYNAKDGSRAVKYHYNGDNEMIFYKVINGGHSVPCKSDSVYRRWQNCDYDALGEAWDFLMAKRK